MTILHRPRARVVTVAAFCATVALVSCLRDGVTGPAGEQDVALRFRAQVGTAAATTIRIGVGYHRVGGEWMALPVTPDVVTLESGASVQQALSVDVASCLADESRAPANTRGCRLDVMLRLLDAAGTLLDSTTTAGEQQAAPGQIMDFGRLAIGRPVGSVQIAPDGASLTVGQAQALTVTVRDTGGSLLPNAGVTWTASDAAVVGLSATTGATVTATALALGRATVVASIGGRSSAPVTIAVVPPPVASVTLTLGSASLVVGQTTQATVVARDAAGTVLTDRVVAYASSDGEVASVSAAGVVTAVGAGTATITATVEGKSATATLVVAPVPVGSIALTPAAASLAVGQTVQLTATALDAGGRPLTGRTITWTSDNGEAAAVSSSGLVTAVGVGVANVTATSEGKSATAVITVTPVAVASVAVSLNSASIAVGQTTQAVVTARDAAGAVLSGRSATFATSNGEVATVSATGLVTGVAPGSATITATVEGTSGSAPVTVTPVPVAGVTLTPATATLAIGATVQLTATPRDASGTPLGGRTVTYATSDAGVATVSATGLVTAVGPGSATITATSEGQSATAAIVVQAPAPLVITPAVASVAQGRTLQLQIVGTPAGVSWTSSDPSVATVDQSGLVTGVFMQSATPVVITATTGSGATVRTGTAQITVTSPWQSAQDAITGMAATYRELQDLGVYGRWMPFAGDLRADDGTSPSPWAELQAFVKFQFPSGYDFEVNRNLWFDHYTAIARANAVIAYAPTVPIAPALRDQLVGEARFLRALLYFDLVNLYGGVPLVTAPQKAGDQPAPASSAQVWAQIEADLLAARPALPATYGGSDVGRATSGAATALLGKVYLQQRNWSQAAATLQSVASSGLYDLVPNYADNFTAAGKNGRESLFEVQFTGAFDPVTGAHGLQIAKMVGPCGPSYCDGRPTQWFVDQFLRERATDGALDPRLDATIFYYKGATTPVFGQTWQQRYGTDTTTKYFKKYSEYYTGSTDQSWDANIDYHVIRFADVLLMQAEALNEQGQTSAAYAPVNRVRARARLAPLAADLSQSGMRTEILHQRLLEFGLESQRWLDLSRQQLLGSVVRANAGSQACLPQPIAQGCDADFQNFAPYKALLPIPTSALQQNPNLRQNPGW